MILNETYLAKDAAEESICKVIRERYDIRRSDTEKIVEKVFNFIENECLEWNNISCQWEIK